MKNLAFLLLVGVLFTSCSNSTTEEETATSIDSSAITVDSISIDTTAVDTAKK